MQQTETRATPLPDLARALQQMPDIAGMELTLPVEEYKRQSERAAAEGKAHEAQRWLWAGLRVADALDDRDRVEQFLEGLLYWEGIQGRIQRQAELCFALIDVRENRGHEERTAEILIRLIRLRVLQGQTELAEIALQRVKGQCYWKNNWTMLAEAHSVRAGAYLELGNFWAAFAELEAAARLRKEQPVWNAEYHTWSDAWAPVTSHDDFANYFYQLGQWERSLQHRRDAIRLLKTTPPTRPPSSPASRQIFARLLAIADLYQERGEPQRALEAAREAETVRGSAPYRIQGEFGQFSGAGLRLGRALLAKGQAPQAERALSEELAFLKTQPDCGPRELKLHELELAKAESQQGKHQEALARAQSVRTFLRSLGWWAFLGHALIEESELARRAGDLALAHTLLKEARELVEKELSVLARLQLLQRIARRYQELGDAPKAAEVLRAAIALYESLLPQMLDPGQSALFGATRARGLYTALAQLSPPQEALLWLERWRGQGAAQQLARSRFDLATLVDPKDSQRLRLARKALTEAGYQLRKAVVQEPQQLEPAQKSWVEMDRRYTDLRTELLACYPLFQQLETPQPPTQEQLLQLARKHTDTLFIEWALGEQSTQCLTLSAQAGVQVRTLPQGETYWSQQVSAWRKAILSESIKERQQERALAQHLGNLLIPGLSPWVKRIVIVADGPLQALPFAALRLPDGRRLIERCPLRQSFSLGALLGRKVTTSPPKNACLVAASPVGSASLPSIYRDSQGTPLLPLGFAREEVEQVARLLKEKHPLTQGAATEALVRPALENSRIIHLAAHGVLLPENSLYSWLVLEVGATGTEDGRLEAREIAGMRLRAELAVLSACDTAVADSSGLQGLAWAFCVAGCPSVVATHWRVEDRSTSQLMVMFYQGLSKQLPKDEALRQAQLKLLKNRVATWAGVTLFGEYNPIPI